MTLFSDELTVAGVRLELLRPSSPEALIDEEAFADDEFLPYWAELWPAARRLAEALPDVDGLRVVELHHATKVDRPSGTAKLTSERMGGDVPIHSVRLPGLNAHQEVILGDAGQTLTIRHDAISREAYTPGVLLALEKLPSLPPGVTVGLDALL